MSHVPSSFGGGAKASKTRLYDLLGVSKDASPADLKKAYRKKSLQLHPDKPTGDAEAFKEMKWAYDLLVDPQKRKAYDRYGEDAIKFMEGDISPEVFMSMFLNIGCFERLLLVLALTICIGYLLLFPVLLSVRWDNPRMLTFGHVFIPIWIALAVTLIVCLCCVHAPSADPEDDSEDTKRQMEEMRQQALKWRVGGSIAVVVLGLLLTLLVLRLDRVTNWSYFTVLWPWMLLELSLFGYKVWSSDSNYVMLGGDPAVLSKGYFARGCEWHIFVFCTTSTHLLIVAFACLVALKLDGMVMSWWTVFTPIWLDCILGVTVRLPWEARLKGDPCGALLRNLMVYLGWVCCLYLLCNKLAHPGSMSAFIVFLPVFVFAGCFCCSLTCMVCCMSPDCLGVDAFEGQEEGLAGAYSRYAASSATGPSGTVYGSTGKRN